MKRRLRAAARSTRGSATKATRRVAPPPMVDITVRATKKTRVTAATAVAELKRHRTQSKDEGDGDGDGGGGTKRHRAQSKDPTSAPQ